MDIRIGCSGYYYASWKNRFYPAGLTAKNWLAYYSSVFNTVELNGTFYRLPKLADLERYTQVTDPVFRFAVKASRFITHVKRLGDAESIRNFQALITKGLGEKLGCFLFQMPPTFTFSEENLANVVQNIPHHSNNVIEFRHISWWNERVQKTLADHGIVFCNVDFPGMQTYIVPTTPVFYMRFHGNPELFKSSYSEDQLQKYFNQVPKTCTQVYIYFNNTMFDAGYTNARDMIRLSKKLLTETNAG